MDSRIIACPSVLCVPTCPRVNSIQRFLYSATPAKHRRILLTLAGEGVRVYDAELVRLICRDINSAKDNPHKQQELIILLQAVLQEDQHETRIRTACVAQ